MRLKKFKRNERLHNTLKVREEERGGGNLYSAMSYTHSKYPLGLFKQAIPQWVHAP